MSESHRCDSPPIHDVDFEPPLGLSLRNHSGQAPIGEEKIPSPSRRRRPRASGATLNKAKLFSHELGLTLRTPAWLHRRIWGEVTHRGFNVTDYGWTAADWPATAKTILSGLRGEFGVSLGNQETVRVVVLDLDHGHGPAPAKTCACASPGSCLCGFDDRTRTERRREERDELRGRVAAKARPIVAKLRESSPAADFVTYSTPRGCHVVFLLEKPLAADEAHELGERILAAVGADQSEAFPKNGRLCRLPGTGSASRMLADDLERPRHGTRLRDLEALLALRRCRPSDFGAAVTVKTPEKTPIPKESHRCDSFSRAELEPAKNRPGENVDDVELRDALGAKLKGDGFEKAMLDVYRLGMPDDASYDCMRKLAFLTASAAGLAGTECIRVAEAFIQLPHHRATHAQTERGRKQLLQVFRSCLKHQLRGIAGRDVEPAKLARAPLWNMLRELLGRQPRLRIAKAFSPSAREAMRDGGRKRWAKDAA